MSASATLPRWAQIGAIVVVGAAAAAALWLTQPRRGDLGPVDFTAGGPDALQFCDAAHPRFIAVTDRVSPVVLEQATREIFWLRTSTGKAIGARDLRGGRLRMYGVDNDLRRFSVGDAEFAGEGRWRWATPRGVSRVFADFTPFATGQEMYASARVSPRAESVRAARPVAGINLVAPATCTAGQEVAAKLALPSGEVAGAELAAFDVGRDGPTGFVVRRPDSTAGSTALFRVTFTDPGQYVLWGHCGARQACTLLTVTP